MSEKKHILFIEDEKRLQESMVSALNEEGFDAVGADDGEMGIKILDKKKIDLVLLDLILPQKDGFQVLEYMKSKKELENIPVVVLSNLEEKFDIDKALSFGVHSYLVKANYSLGEIIKKIKEILNEGTA